MSRLSQLVSTSSALSSLTKPLVVYTPLGYTLIKSYSKHQGEEKEDLVLDKERAPSTAEVMRDLYEEKDELQKSLDEKSKQGFVSQTSEKAVDAAQEAVGGDTDPQAVKKTYKEAAPGETYHKPRDDGGVGPTSV